MTLYTTGRNNFILLSHNMPAALVEYNQTLHQQKWDLTMPLLIFSRQDGSPDLGGGGLPAALPLEITEGLYL